MGPGSDRFSCVVLGEQSLLIQCCEEMRRRGHSIAAVVSSDARISEWSARNGIPCTGEFTSLGELEPFDFLFSITNLRILPGWLIEKPRRMSINFHDGPLPQYAGLNVPAWAILNGETQHGVTWHQMDAGADTGPVLVTRRFPIDPNETAFTLNALCYQEGMAAFSDLLDGIENGTLVPQAQDLSQRRYFEAARRPVAAGVLDWAEPAQRLQRTVRALDFGSYPNPLLLPKIDTGRSLLLAREAETVATPTGDQPPGTIEGADSLSLTIRCGDGALRLTRVTDLDGAPVDPEEALRAAGFAPGDRLPPLAPAEAEELSAAVRILARHETFWVRRLEQIEPLDVPFASGDGTSGEEGWEEVDLPRLSALPGDPGAEAIAAVALLLGRLANKNRFTLAYVPASGLAQPEWFFRFFSLPVPLPVSVDLSAPFDRVLGEISAAMAESESRVSHLNDLEARQPQLRSHGLCASLPVRVVRGPADPATARRWRGGAALTVVVPRDGGRIGFLADGAQLRRDGLRRIVDCLLAVHPQIASVMPVGDLNLLSAADRDVLARFNSSAGPEAPPRCVHELFEQQAEATPDRAACIFAGRSYTYRELNQAANRIARLLRDRGVRTGDLVGVLVRRSFDMLVALYAVHKAGAAYVPLDPAYPADRLGFMIDDAALRVVIAHREFAGLARGATLVLEDAAASLSSMSPDNLGLSVPPSSLAYVIYTSGSTGRPKGVMVEHRNVVNFFLGMDQRLGTDPGIWLAVTSISFDISVLELFWTLARGFTVVLYSEREERAGPTVLSGTGARRLEFGLFYWNVASEENTDDPDKYRLLLEGAKFADSHGFNAVWNPERHFQSFGGLFPNPSVTCAALATITRNVALRAGSCVVPLHSPIRIAEEWSVVDNLSKGRVGLSIAAGWAAPDFAIRPESFANAKQVMFESAELIRRLWRGETVSFPGPHGEVPVRTLPRPIQRELPLWVTTAGSLETFIHAGESGLNLLTHLLGQTVEEVAEKVRAYRKAWTDAGHPGRGTVTLMLHTFVGPDADAVEQAVREPLKNYLRSAMYLVKAAAWQFPTFKKLSEDQGKKLDEFFTDISDEDMDGLLEFAFQRYFHSSGLFGTPESCMEMIGRVENADVDEIACLIDYGVDVEVVLRHLPYLDALRERVQGPSSAAEPAPDQEDHSLPALLRRHEVTHFQCTPSMATMLVSDSMARPALATVRHMMVGGEAFPPDLARALVAAVGGRVSNMYGPTETTIWSATGDLEPGQIGPRVPIGRPLLNQSVHVLDDRQRPLPPGLVGELVIGGAGVVRGYWQRPEQTAERFVPDLFAADGGRMYRTGDLGRWLPDGRLECLGRADHQVKIRGYRVELGEIETLLRGHDTVAEAAVLLREDIPGDSRLVAYVRPVAGGTVDGETLRTALRRHLPDFMVPSVWVPLDAMPLTPNGKIDRKALPAPLQRELPAASYTPPQSDAEALITEIWQRALGVSSIGTRVNFFDVGGHSLLAVQVLAELRERVSRPLRMTDLFRHTTIESLAKFISEEPGQSQALDRSRKRADARRAALERRRT